MTGTPVMRDDFPFPSPIRMVPVRWDDGREGEVVDMLLTLEAWVEAERARRQIEWDRQAAEEAEKQAAWERDRVPVWMEDWSSTERSEDGVVGQFEIRVMTRLPDRSSMARLGACPS